MTDRVQLDHVLIDVDFLDKPKVVALMARYGHVSALFLIQVMATLSKATNAEMDVYAAYGLGAKFFIPLDQAKTIVDHCVKEEMLSLNGELLTQRRVAEDQEKCAVARARKAENQRLYRERQRLLLEDNNVIDNAIHEESASPVTDTDTVTDTEDLNKNSLPKTITEICARPENLTKPEIELWVIAGKAFPPDESDKPWRKSASYISHRRRPLRDFPNIWISHKELFDALKIYDSKGLSPDEWLKCFADCETRAKSAVVSGKPPDRLPTPSWLSSFILDGVLEQHLRDLKINEVRRRQ